MLWKLADGSGPEEELLSLRDHTHIGSWSPDGQVLAFELQTGGTGSDIGVLSLKGDRKPSIFLRTRFGEAAPVFSPDSHWIAYASNESGRYEVYVQPFPGPGGKWQISTEGGTEPVWARNGRELFYRSGDKMMAVDIAAQATFSAGKPRVLFEGRYNPTGSNAANYDVSPDGQRFVMIQPVGSEGGVSQIHVVLNWFEELKRRVPAP